jgi:hypothetical protein
MDMGFLKRFSGQRGKGTSNGSGYKTYKTKGGTTIKQGTSGKAFTHRSVTKTGGSKSTTYWYDAR